MTVQEEIFFNNLSRGDKVEIVKNVDIHKLLRMIGFRPDYESSDIMRGCCPVHNGDNPTAFQINLNAGESGTPLWICRTQCDCGGDLFSLVMRKYNTSFQAAAAALMRLGGTHRGSLGLVDKKAIARDDTADFCHKFHKNKKQEKTVSPHLTETFVRTCEANSCNYFQNRGFSTEVLEEARVGFCKSDTIFEWSLDRVTIPWWDTEGILQGISGRALEDCKNKYKILEGSNKREVLYGIDIAQQHIRRTGVAIITEGFCDVWKCRMMGFSNSVALMGKSLSFNQKKKILSLANIVVLALDPDKTGLIATRKINTELSPFCTTRIVKLPSDKDIGDLTELEFKQIVEPHLQ
jgi:hypothetical protein